MPGNAPRKPTEARGGIVADRLTKSLRGVSGETLRAFLKRDRAFTFRLSENDRATMEKAARAMDLSASEYMLRIHHFVYGILRDAGEVE